MERLTLPTTISHKFRRVLKSEMLDNLSQFFTEGFFDETPLYSRDSQLSFLSGYDVDRRDDILLRLGLDYLDSLVRHQTPAACMFAALTVNDYSKQDLLQPNIFVCTGQVDERLGGRLILRPPSSVFAKRMVVRLAAVTEPGRYQILQDTLTVPRKARVFIAPDDSIHPLMVGVGRFEEPSKPRNGLAARIGSHDGQ